MRFFSGHKPEQDKCLLLCNHFRSARQLNFYRSRMHFPIHKWVQVQDDWIFCSFFSASFLNSLGLFSITTTSSFYSNSSPSLRYGFPYAGRSPHKADFLFSAILSLLILFPTNQFPYRQPQMTALTHIESARVRQLIYNKQMGERTSYFFYWLLMLTLYGMDCKLFLDLFSGDRTTEKKNGNGSYKRSIFTPCNPRQPHFTIEPISCKSHGSP